MKEIKDEADLLEYLHEVQMTADAPTAMSARIAKELLPPFAKILMREQVQGTDPTHVVRAFTNLLGSIVYNVAYAYAKPGAELLVAQAVAGKIYNEVTRMVEEDKKNVADSHKNG